ncbi:hypothetical protein EO98_18845 [Methanosarcina sp. 2.H.T.1A.6]|nr:hypothetical protein EO94_18045 [Methanosarcina sp. 2.H.T.1A.3]KKG20381.1 hypothetical protein EO98_18845 [Methanosarcina sp. 2.H.T.1A.6]KKG23354.1 hypothetical protein EO96_17010 [Methanosarcina sp. 2.H.T.1A.8]KKG27754.1 hypothetical protein EO97_00800 [Methanosarcina sp. 2.H.T.1A.15]
MAINLQRLRFLEPIFFFKKSVLLQSCKGIIKKSGIIILEFEEKIAFPPEFWKFRILIRDAFVLGRGLRYLTHRL